MDLKYMKAGYQDRPDPMREMAEKLSNPSRGDEPQIIFSKSAADRERIRPYKEGGMVSKKIVLNTKPHIEKMKKDISKEEERERREEKQKKDTSKADEQAYKKGGHVQKCDKKQKFAAGGIAKIRLDEATSTGKQILKKKKSYTNNF
jgi:hypothetical protein